MKSKKRSKRVVLGEGYPYRLNNEEVVGLTKTNEYVTDQYDQVKLKPFPGNKKIRLIAEILP